MAKLIEIAWKPVDRAVDWLIDSALREADYTWNCKKYVADLRVAVHKLTEGRKRIFRLKEDADKRGETTPPTVDEWLKNTKQCIENAEEFLTLEDSPKMKCCVVMCPNCKTRHQRGRQAKAEIMEVVNNYIAESEKFQEISYREAPPSLRPVKEYESFESRASICKNIMEAMSDPVVNKIGLYGINGVGKTTLATEIAKQALEDKLYDEVAMATVFKYHNMREMQGGMAVLNAQDIRRIQGEIAEGLGFQFQSETEFGRERELRERLKDGKKKLLVLDDIWRKFDLKDLGMDDLGGCKILMTSINQPVLSQMGSKDNFMLDKLQINEARDWFNRMVGEVLENPDFGTVAEKVADRCGGLPILLIPVAKGLKDKDEVNIWNEALNQLSGFDQDEMHADVNLALQLSYNLIGGDEIKSLFRLCGYLKDPIAIEDMFKYAFGLGLLTKNNTMKDCRSQLLAFVKKLKDSCLLSEGNSSRVVKMHETIRNFVVSVASTDRVFTLAPYTTLSDWPEEKALRKLTSVYLFHCNIAVLPEEFECQEIESFVLVSNNRSLKIPDNFFKGMRKLKVLDLTGIYFSQLPPSLHILKHLRTLCLDWCVLKDIKVIGELKRLQVLSFVGADISELPKELQHLSDLRLLDLSQCKNLALIEARLIEVLSSLGNLEELCMEGTILQSSGISASLAKLKRLSKLHIHITDVKMLPKGNFWEGLKWFRIFIGEGWNWSGEYRTPTTLKIKLSRTIQWNTSLQHLLKNTEDLYLDELKGIKGSVYELDSSGFPGLKHLHVENSSDIQFIVNSTRLCDAFTSLESLFLDNLQKLKRICDGPLTPVSFSKLMVLDVGRCGALESVISSSMVGGLLRLEEIKIVDCKSLKEIITEDSTDDVVNDKAIELPQLRKLVLHSLPLFSRLFSNGNAPTPSMSQITRHITESSTRSEEIVHEIENNTPIPLFSERIHIRNLKELKLASISIDKIWDDQILEKPSCVQNLTSFTIFGCDKLKYLFSSVMLGSLVNLKTLQVSNCRMIEQIIITEGAGEIKVTFSPLDNLKLENLPELTQVCRSNLFECPGLKELSIINCPKLRKFVSNSNVAVSIEAETTSFSLFDENVAFSNLEGLTITKMNGIKLIWHDEFIIDSFSKLKRLSISNAEDLAKLFPSNYMLSKSKNVETLIIEDCKSLEDCNSIEEVKISVLKVSSFIKTIVSLTVDGCDNLEHLFSSSMVEGLVNLKILKVINCRMMQQIIMSEEGMIKLRFRKLELLQVESLPKLRQVCISDLFECPALKELMIMNCSELRMFVSKPKEVIEAVDDEDEEANFSPSDEKENEAVDNDDEETKSLFYEDEYDEYEEANFSLFDKKVLFPNLEVLQITNINRINRIWRNEFHDGSFYNLKQLSIFNVLLLENVFPSNYVMSRLQNVETLSIEYCNSLEEIFGCKEITNTTHLSVATELKCLKMKELENLKRIWNDGAAEAHSFQNLHEVIVEKCPNLKIVFPAPVATEGFPQLARVEITDCSGLEEIVSKEEGKEFITDFGLPELKMLWLHKLPKLRSFYPGSHTSKFPKLKILSVYCCSQIEIFSFDSQHFEGQLCEDQIEISLQPILSAEQVIPTVEQLSLNSNDATILLNGSFPASLLGNVKALYLQCFEDELGNFPFDLIQRFNNLEQLRIRSCCFKDIFAHDGFVNENNQGNHLENVRELTLYDLYNLKHIKLDHAIKKLERLYVSECNKLTILAPSTASFRNLKILLVSKCHGLIKLMTSSTAESMVQLIQLHVQNCKGLREIIEGRADITFHKLRFLRLDCLISLTNFCSSVCTLGFPVLEKVILKQCPKMKKFSRGNLHVPNLWEVQTEGRDKITWMGDLNATVHQLYIQQVGFYGLKQMKLSEFPELKDRWSNQLPVQIFDLLISLVVDELASCSRVVPWSLLRCLNLLEELEVRNCKSVDEVFDIEHLDTTESAKYLSRLTKFQLVDLPKLKYAWNVNDRGMLDFRRLKHLQIQNCGSLTHIFTVSMLLCACALKQMEVKNCHKVKEIIAQDEIQDAEIDTISVWQRINSITLDDLPSLTCFYSGSATIEFLALETLVVVDCPDAFTSRFLRAEEGTNDEATFVFPCLKKLRVAWDNVMNEIIQADFFCGLKDLELIHCPGGHAVFPYHILRRLPNLENLTLGDAALEEIAFREETDHYDDHLTIATQIKGLKLYKFPKLTLLSKDSQSQLILQNLESLIVSECANLKLLVPFLASFDCLTILEVSKCHGLTNLIISSAVKSLVQLTTLIVSECQTMMEVIAEDSNMTGSDIIFCKLKCLALQSMQTLTRFYSGKCALMFPKLEEVYLNECPKIEVFSLGDVMMPKLKKLQLSEGENKENSESSHYAHLLRLFTKMREAVVQIRTPRISRQQNKDIETTHAEKVLENVVLEEMDSVRTKPPISTKNLTPHSETTNKIARDEVTRNSSIMKADISDVSDSSSVTLNKKIIKNIFSKKLFSFKQKEVSAYRESANKIASEEENLAASSTSNNMDKVLTDISDSHTTDVEQAIVSFTNKISSQEPTNVAAFKPTPPSFQIGETSTHSGSPFDKMQIPPSSSKLAASSITVTHIPDSTSINPEKTYRDHVRVLKKLLAKPLSQVSTSKDVLLLWSSLKSLKSCPHLNPQQTEVIQCYIEHFDTLVNSRAFYDDKMDRISSLKLSLQEDIERIPELKTIYDNLANKAGILSAEKEVLMKKLREVEKEEAKVRGDMEDLCDELETKNVKLNAISEAEMLQKEVEDKTKCADDYWTKFRDLFA